ncbi:MAG TPA: FmdB family zinc ribbon protein [Thermodesulfovibrionales bacterium]|jgi:putative FmdB family regulatory protein|nr:FmdB family zinc ribbon protein [Thermodesulfovibrionales bacterium]
MPIYEYECTACGRHHEMMQRHSDSPLLLCPDCGGHMRKLISPTSFVLKGSGWYKTDYASGDRKTKQDAEGETTQKTGATSEDNAGKKSEPPSKSEDKSEKKPEVAAKSE